MTGVLSFIAKVRDSESTREGRWLQQNLLKLLT